MELMRDRVLRQVAQAAGCAYWSPGAVGPLLIAEEILPPEDSDVDEDTADASAGSESKNERE
eukprot:4824776-Pyramimonas_sp.AAC.1